MDEMGKETIIAHRTTFPTFQEDVVQEKKPSYDDELSNK